MSRDAVRSEPIVDYFAWLHRLVPAVAADLRPPAAEADIAAVEARVGFALPAEVRAMYLLHDGQHGIGEAVTIGAIYGMEFLPLAEVTREWEAQAAAQAGYVSWYRQRNGLADAARVPQVTRELVVAPDKVAGALWQPGWIPLFRQPLRRDYLAVDLQPERLGVAGQIINFGRNEHVGYVAAVGLADFFAVLLEWAAVEGTGQNVEALREHLTGLSLDDGRVLHRMADRARGGPERKAAVTPLVPIGPAQPAHGEPREPAGPPPPRSPTRSTP